MNNEKWMNMRGTGMRRHWNEERGKINKAWLETTGEDKRKKNDELEAPLVSSWESPDKNIEGKEWRGFTSIRWILD
jgi:hypothetical protein